MIASPQIESYLPWNKLQETVLRLCIWVKLWGLHARGFGRVNGYSNELACKDLGSTRWCSGRLNPLPEDGVCLALECLRGAADKGLWLPDILYGLHTRGPESCEGLVKASGIISQPSESKSLIM